MKRTRIIGIDIGGTKCAVADLSPGRDPVIGLACGGPVGYRKAGSFESFCSGGGIAQLVRYLLRAWRRAHPDAHAIALAARRGDRAARAVCAALHGLHLLGPEK